MDLEAGPGGGGGGGEWNEMNARNLLLIYAPEFFTALVNYNRCLSKVP